LNRQAFRVDSNDITKSVNNKIVNLLDANERRPEKDRRALQAAARQQTKALSTLQSPLVRAALTPATPVSETLTHRDYQFDVAWTRSARPPRLLIRRPGGKLTKSCCRQARMTSTAVWPNAYSPAARRVAATLSEAPACYCQGACTARARLASSALPNQL